MERRLTAFVAIAATLCLGSSALAQRSVDGSPPSAQRAQVNDGDLKTFARIYRTLQASADRHKADLAAAQSEQEARTIAADFEQETMTTLSKHGWTADKYDSIVSAINADPDLAERTLALINDTTDSVQDD